MPIPTGTLSDLTDQSGSFLRNHTGKRYKSRFVQENALLDPGADGNGVLSLVAQDAPEAVKARAKSFIAYKRLGERPEQVPNYLLKTPTTVTLSSQFHTMGTAIGRDICEPLSRGNSARTVLITRMGIVFGGPKPTK